MARNDKHGGWLGMLTLLIAEHRAANPEDKRDDTALAHHIMKGMIEIGVVTMSDDGKYILPTLINDDEPED